MFFYFLGGESEPFFPSSLKHLSDLTRETPACADVYLIQGIAHATAPTASYLYGLLDFTSRSPSVLRNFGMYASCDTPPSGGWYGETGLAGDMLHTRVQYAFLFSLLVAPLI